jgi:DNA-directed RNA polymerase subunit RPC12/RpoP
VRYLIATALLVTGCTNGYYKCDNCGSAYKSMGGLPGQMDAEGWMCRNCGKGRLYETTEEESGWDEERYQRIRMSPCTGQNGRTD